MTDRRKVKNIIKTSLLVTLLSVSILAFFSALWYKNLYGDVGFDAILFTLFSDLNGADTDLLMRYFLNAAVPSILLSAVVNFFLL